MVLIAERAVIPHRAAALRSMFEARKRVFVDLLKWDVPVLEGRFEVDQFDDENAIYVVLAGKDGEHRASARLLPTTRPHILDTLFPSLCAEPPPRGPEIYEITRFCLDPRQSSRSRAESRNRLVAALVDHALANGISTYTGVAELGWLQQILAFGWSCRPLGLPRPSNGKLLGALAIDVRHDTPALLAASGIYPRHRVEALEAA